MQVKIISDRKKPNKNHQAVDTSSMSFRVFLLALFVCFAAVAGEPSKKIVVVGGGISGLSTVDHLSEELSAEIKKNQVDVKLYSDSSRLGGRIWSETVVINGDPLVINRGAELIDSDHHGVLGLVKKVGASLLDRRAGEKLRTGEFFYQGEPYSQEDTVKRLLANPEPLKRIALDQEKIRLERETRLAPGEVMTPTERELDRLSFAEYLKKMGVDDFQREYLEVTMSEAGVPAKKLSAISLFDHYEFDPSGKAAPAFLYDNDEVFRVKGGTQKLTDGLVNLHKENIETGNKLVAVESSGNKTYRLTFATKDGNRVVTADHVVLSMPFHELAKVKVDVPGYPAAAKAAAEGTLYGKHTKLILHFDERVWNTKFRHNGEAIAEEFQLWDSSLGQPGKAGHLTFFFGEKGPGEFQEEVEVKKALARLEKLFPGISKHYVKSDVQSWQQSYAGGPGVGERSKVKNSFSRLVGNLYVSHEGVDPVNVGYMEGAVQSGKRAADQIVREIQIENSASLVEKAKSLAKGGVLSREAVLKIREDALELTDVSGRVTPALQEQLTKIETTLSFSPDAKVSFQTLVADVGGKLKAPIQIAERSIPYWLKDPGPLDHFKSSKVLPKTVDYLVVGAGLTGTSVAKNLTPEVADGKSVVVLEKGPRPAFGASGRNGGNIEMLKESFLEDYRGFVEVQKDFLRARFPNLNEQEVTYQAERQSRYLMEFFKENVREITDTVKDLKVSADVSMTGWLRIAETAEEAKGLQEETDFAKKLGLEFEIWSPQKIKEVTGIESKFPGRYIRESGNYHPFKFVNGVLQDSIKKGVKLYTETGVTAMERQADGSYLVKTDGGEIRAKKVVLATNGYMRELFPELTFLEPRVSMISNYAHVPNRFQGMTVTRNKGDWYANFPKQDQYVDPKGENRGTLKVGGDVDRPYDPAIVWDPPKSEDSFRLVNRLTNDAIPETAGQPPVRTWSGTMMFTEDRAPVISFFQRGAEEDKNLIIAMACNGYGGSQCAYAGKAAAEMAKTGKTPAALPEDLFSMKRFLTDQPLFPVKGDGCGKAFRLLEAKK